LLIRSISGLRGTVGVERLELTAEVVARYAASFARYHGNKGTIAVGYDGRVGGSVLYELCIAVLRSSGCHVLALGMVPTPTVQMAVEFRPEAVGGISITASHNPAQWNGMKFIAESGLFLDAGENTQLWDIVDEGQAGPVDAVKFGEFADGSWLREDHVRAVLAIPMLDVAKIGRKKLRVVLDAVNASGSFVQQQLLKSLGVAEIVPLYCDGSGIFPHTPEPIPQNLTSLKRTILEENADLGVVVDPDADRLVLMMENGEPFGEENTIVVAVDEVLKHAERDQKVVVNLSTTRAVEDIAAKYGATVVRTAVGEINVARRMRDIGAIVGGEGSGGVILPSVHLGRDSLVAVALALSALADFDGPISAFKRSLPQYEIVKSKIELEGPEQVRAILGGLEDIFAEDALGRSSEDGLRIDFARSWIHARASNTEPIIRLIAEAPTRAEADALLERAQSALA
jgi:phosphomannomutase